MHLALPVGGVSARRRTILKAHCAVEVTMTGHGRRIDGLAVEATDLMLNVIVMGLEEESGAPSPVVAFVLAVIESGLRCNTLGGGILVVAEHDLAVAGAVDKVFRLVTIVTG